MGFNAFWGFDDDHSSIDRFLRDLSPGTRVRVQFDGGGANGLFRARFQGFDKRGNALFNNVRFIKSGTRLRGLTRIAPNRINSVSVR